MRGFIFINLSIFVVLFPGCDGKVWKAGRRNASGFLEVVDFDTCAQRPHPELLHRSGQNGVRAQCAYQDQHHQAHPAERTTAVLAQ